MTIFAFTRHTGVRIAEIGFALIALAGVLLTLGQVSRSGRTGTVAAGVSLAAGAVIILIAIRWGSFGAVF